MEQVEVGIGVGHVLRIGQAGHGVFGGEAGNVEGGLHRLANGGGGEIRGGRIAALLAQVHRNAKRFVAVALHILQLALAHRDAEPRAFRHFCSSVDRPELPGVGEGQIDEFLELAAGVLETGEGGAGIGCGAGTGGLGEFFHVDGYDTCRPSPAAALDADAHFTLLMSRKPTKGYFVRGQFVALGSELDLELKRELKGSDDMSKTDLKKYSDRLQQLGESLLDLRADLMKRLDLSEKLVDAINEAKKITNFEGRRRQMQYIGKLMRGVSEATLAEVEAALDEQNKGSAKGTLSLHLAEQWRDRLIADDEALTHWLQLDASADVQQLRALIRQARKDALTTQAQERPGEAVRHGKAYREIFQTVKAALNQDSAEEAHAAKDPDDDEEHP